MRLLRGAFDLLRVLGGPVALFILFTQLNRYVFRKPGSHFSDYANIPETLNTEILLAPLVAAVVVVLTVIHRVRASKRSILNLASLGMAAFVLVFVTCCEIPSLRHRIRLFSYQSGLSAAAPQSVGLDGIVRRFPELLPDLLDDESIRRTLIARAPSSVLHHGARTAPLLYAALRADGATNDDIWALEKTHSDGETYAWGAHLMFHLLMAEASGEFPPTLAQRIPAANPEPQETFALGYLSYPQEKQRLRGLLSETEQRGGLYLKEFLTIAKAHPGLLDADAMGRLLDLWREKWSEGYSDYSVAIDAVLAAREQLCAVATEAGDGKRVGLRVTVPAVVGLPIEQEEIESDLAIALSQLLATCGFRTDGREGIEVVARIEQRRLPGTVLTRQVAGVEMEEERRYDHVRKRWVNELVEKKARYEENFTGTLVAPVLVLTVRGGGQEETLEAPPYFTYRDAPQEQGPVVHALEPSEEYPLPHLSEILLRSWRLGTN
jgi:hypothetical protein